MKKRNYRESLKNIALISQIGLSVIIPIFMGVYIGQLIDARLGLNGFFSIILILIGTASGFLNIFKLTVGLGKKRK